ncbi:NAD-dependent epimerase/dehydratase family protein [Vallitalea okinawensis]|uniref:NAD-dependent epimerase/dehydratase family protein n=1 Tax=Vallitalea okinawensis TaxID=2078660 RepID=UPI000CFC3234|nr:NAD-dependent epimerase/dehydratase family protein [Vallitalea okinawensis]
MKILIIGGKKFIGYHIALEAEKRGHDVTFFNRGQTYKELLPQFPCITGDRNEDMEKVKGMDFDAVIDTCAYFPHQVEKSVRALGDSIKKYLLVSTISTCDLSIAHFKETDPTCGIDFDSKEITGGTYGPLKVGCEKVLTDMLGHENSLIIRPGFIVGERDHTDRFTYWPVMMDAMEEMIVPETGDLGFQFIDVRDLAAFIIHGLEKELHGIYLLTGPEQSYTFKEFIQDCHKFINPECQLKKVNEQWLLEHGIEKSQAFPLCYDETMAVGIHCVDITKALKAGLKTRLIEETLLSALEWYKAYKGDANDLAVGLNPTEMMKLMK